jgi:hypothetical protein
MTGAATASASQQDLRSPDARDAAAGRGTFTSRDVSSPQMFTDRQFVVVTRFKRSPSYQQALREAITAVKPPQPAPVRADEGIDWRDAGIGAASLLGVTALGLAGAMTILQRRRRGAQRRLSPDTPSPTWTRRGAGMSGPAPRRDAVRRRSRRKAQATEPVSITPATDDVEERRGERSTRLHCWRMRAPRGSSPSTGLSELDEHDLVAVAAALSGRFRRADRLHRVLIVEIEWSRPAAVRAAAPEWRPAQPRD